MSKLVNLESIQYISYNNPEEYVKDKNVCIGKDKTIKWCK